MKKHKGVNIIKATESGWVRYELVSIVKGEEHRYFTSVRVAKLMIDKALKSDRVTIQEGQMVFPTTHDYFALFEDLCGEMPTAADVAKEEELYARMGWND